QLGEGDRGGRGERDALVRRAEEDVEADSGGERRAGIEARRFAEALAIAEQSRIEEVRREPSRLGPELPEAQHAGADREVDELAPESFAVVRRGVGGGVHAVEPRLR